jgi:hypothetical protein
VPGSRVLRERIRVAAVAVQAPVEVSAAERLLAALARPPRVGSVAGASNAARQVC